MDQRPVVRRPSEVRPKSPSSATEAGIEPAELSAYLADLPRRSTKLEELARLLASHRELLRVPLIVKRPGDPGGTVAPERVRQLEIAPTVLSFAGLDSTLPGFVLGQGSAAEAIAEGSLWSGDLYSIRTDAGTLMMRRSTGDTSFYAADDPGEFQSGSVDPAMPGLQERLDAIPRPRVQAPSEMTDEQRARLKSLGYL